MKLHELPVLNGKKTMISGYGLMIAGFAAILKHISMLLMAEMDLVQFITGLPNLYDNFIVALSGLGLIGIRHAISKK